MEQGTYERQKTPFSANSTSRFQDKVRVFVSKKPRDRSPRSITRHGLNRSAANAYTWTRNAGRVIGSGYAWDPRPENFARDSRGPVTPAREATLRGLLHVCRPAPLGGGRILRNSCHRRTDPCSNGHSQRSGAGGCHKSKMGTHPRGLAGRPLGTTADRVSGVAASGVGGNARRTCLCDPMGRLPAANGQTARRRRANFMQLVELRLGVIWPRLARRADFLGIFLGFVRI